MGGFGGSTGRRERGSVREKRTMRRKVFIVVVNVNQHVEGCILGGNFSILGLDTSESPADPFGLGFLEEPLETRAQQREQIDEEHGHVEDEDEDLQVGETSP